ncbi:MAG: class I adenylate cyclase [Desulfomonilia bacterium]|nr:class I adenylate cyclase [Desulfomonilia bacterium]
MNDTDSALSKAVRAFTHFNRTKKRIMARNDPLGAQVINELLPLLIHINHPDLPGFVGNLDCPCGVKSMEWPANTLKKLPSLLSSRISLADMQDAVPRYREIEGIFTIGSMGSLGQTKDSDYDLWVVVNASQISKSRMKLLERKLKALKRWIAGRYVMVVHFFLMDAEDIRQNNFGVVSQEGSGSALKTILKEEFYRTMTLIEGRIPVWWVTPADGDAGAYARTCDAIGNSEQFLKDEFIDLGDVTMIPEQELLGAALWQMHKALDDPLKSVLKMALMATYLEESDSNQLLCNVLKHNAMRATTDDIVDPYLEILRRVEAFYFAHDQPKTVDLLRKCFYLKIAPGIRLNDLMMVSHDDKLAAMVSIIKSWGWSLRVLKDLNRFSEWPVERYRAFGDEIHEYLKLTTIRLIRRAKNHLIDSTPEQDVETEILRRRVEACYVAKEGKIDCEKRVKRKEPCFQEIFFSYTNGLWRMSGSSPEMPGQSPVMVTERVARILAWLAYNKRFDASTAFHMSPNFSQVVLADIQALMWDLSSLIPDANSIGLDRESLMEEKFFKQMVVIGNLECPASVHSIREVDILTINSWNELFCLHMVPEQLRIWIRKTRTARTKVNIWLPKGGNSRYLGQVLMSMITETDLLAQRS